MEAHCRVGRINRVHGKLRRGLVIRLSYPRGPCSVDLFFPRGTESGWGQAPRSTSPCHAVGDEPARILRAVPRCPRRPRHRGRRGEREDRGSPRPVLHQAQRRSSERLPASSRSKAGACGRERTRALHQKGQRDGAPTGGSFPELKQRRIPCPVSDDQSEGRPHDRFCAPRLEARPARARDRPRSEGSTSSDIPPLRSRFAPASRSSTSPATWAPA
jgi:hypothetical protein